MSSTSHAHFVVGVPFRRIAKVVSESRELKRYNSKTGVATTIPYTQRVVYLKTRPRIRIPDEPDENDDSCWAGRGAFSGRVNYEEGTCIRFNLLRWLTKTWKLSGYDEAGDRARIVVFPEPELVVGLTFGPGALKEIELDSFVDGKIVPHGGLIKLIRSARKRFDRIGWTGEINSILVDWIS